MNDNNRTVNMKQWHQHSIFHLVMALVSLSLSSCMPTPSHENAEAMKKMDKVSLSLLTQRVKQESEKVSGEQKVLQEGLQKIKPPAARLEPLAPKFDPLEAVNVTVDVDNGDAQMVLEAIARQAHMNLMLSPQLSRFKRTISMHLKDVPARVVFEQTLGQLDLYGKVEGSVLLVMSLQEKLFKLNFLQTTLTADFTAGGDVFGANNIGSGSGGGSGSGSGGNVLQGNFTLTGTSGKENDPYVQIEQMLDKIIGKNDAGGKNNTASASDKTAGGLNPAVSIQQNEPAQQNGPIYALNRMTGTLFVRGKPSQVKAVTRMINHYKEVLQRQILIEAQILDVSLNDSHQYGIDWSLLRRQVASSYAGSGGQQLGAISSTLPGGANTGRAVTLPAITSGALGKVFGFGYVSSSFDVALNLLKNFGTVRVLSNPTLRAKNARPALINVGTNTRFVAQSGVTTNNLGGSTTTTANVTTDSVFNGVMVGVIPFIGDDGKVSLTIHPIETEVDANSLALIDVGGGNRLSLPVVDFKGMSTSLNIRDGDTVMLGGLIDENGTTGGDGIPWLSRLPGLGYLFGSRHRTTTSRELVIVLTVHVL